MLFSALSERPLLFLKKLPERFQYQVRTRCGEQQTETTEENLVFSISNSWWCHQVQLVQSLRIQHFHYFFFLLPSLHLEKGSAVIPYLYTSSLQASLEMRGGEPGFLQVCKPEVIIYTTHKKVCT